MEVIALYTYLVNNSAERNNHFYKFQYLDEVRNYISNQNSQGYQDPTGGVLMSTSVEENAPNANVLVYRTKDVVDAINTSIIMDGMKKVNYLKCLNDDENEFSGDSDLVEICKDVGTCDIY